MECTSQRPLLVRKSWRRQLLCLRSKQLFTAFTVVKPFVGLLERTAGRRARFMSWAFSLILHLKHERLLQDSKSRSSESYPRQHIRLHRLGSFPKLESSRMRSVLGPHEAAALLSLLLKKEGESATIQRSILRRGNRALYGCRSIWCRESDFDWTLAERC